MSKIKLLLLVGAAFFSHPVFAITNAELARLNNELIGLDAQLAVAKKQAELAKYANTLPARATSPAPQQEGAKPSLSNNAGTEKSKAMVEKPSPAQSLIRPQR